MVDLSPLIDFLGCETPDEWIHVAIHHQPLLLVDHANCEKKAASTAMNLMYRYIDCSELLKKMSQLAREELLHFEQVVNIMQEREIDYVYVGPSRYAGELRKLVRTYEPWRLVDTLIVGAFVEARSCERFARLAPFLEDAQLKKFYESLLKSEARHFEDYLSLAELYADNPNLVRERVDEFRKRENELIQSQDSAFRFHSGVPEATETAYA